MNMLADLMSLWNISFSCNSLKPCVIWRRAYQISCSENRWFFAFFDNIYLAISPPSAYSMIIARVWDSCINFSDYLPDRLLPYIRLRTLGWEMQVIWFRWVRFVSPSHWVRPSWFFSWHKLDGPIVLKPFITESEYFLHIAKGTTAKYLQFLKSAQHPLNNFNMEIKYKWIFSLILCTNVLINLDHGIIPAGTKVFK